MNLLIPRCTISERSVEVNRMQICEDCGHELDASGECPIRVTLVKKDIVDAHAKGVHSKFCQSNKGICQETLKNSFQST